MQKHELLGITWFVSLLILSYLNVLNGLSTDLFAVVVFNSEESKNVSVECLSTVGKVKNIKFGKLKDINKDILIQHYFEEKASKRSKLFHFVSTDRHKFGGIYFCEHTYKNTKTKAMIITNKHYGIKLLHKVGPYLGNVILEAHDYIKKNNPFITWIHNETNKLKYLFGKTSIELSNLHFNSAGIYNYGNKSEIYLAVKDCPDNFYGDQCIFSGPCFNGGLAFNKGCRCPAGFVGLQCEKACNITNLDPSDPSYKLCRKNPSELNKVVFLCLPHPFGCTCHSGYKGPDCLEECPAGFYGPDCHRKCHCKNGPWACNRFTGQCRGDCESGWIGPMCQIKECDVGYYGNNCSEKCHCLHPFACHPITGACQTGCLKGWTGESCHIRENKYKPPVI